MELAAEIVPASRDCFDSGSKIQSVFDSGNFPVEGKGRVGVMGWWGGYFLGGKKKISRVVVQS